MDALAGRRGAGQRSGPGIRRGRRHRRDGTRGGRPRPLRPGAMECRPAACLRRGARRGRRRRSDRTARLRARGHLAALRDLARAVGRRRIGPALLSAVRAVGRLRGRPSHGVCEQLLQRRDREDRPFDLRVPREDERVGRHRLPLPDRSFRPRLRGARRRDPRGSDRLPFGRIQHALDRSRADRFVSVGSAAVRSDVYATGLPKIFRPKLSPGVFTPNGDGRSDTLRTTAALSDGASWQVRVRDSANTLMRSWSGNGSALDVRWDGRNANGQQAPHGRYKVSVTATRSGKSATPIEIVAGLYRDPRGAWTRAGALDSSTGPRVAGPSGTFHLLARDAEGALRHWRWSSGVWTAGDRLGSAAVAGGPLWL